MKIPRMFAHLLLFMCFALMYLKKICPRDKLEHYRKGDIYLIKKTNKKQKCSFMFNDISLFLKPTFYGLFQYF